MCSQRQLSLMVASSPQCGQQLVRLALCYIQSQVHQQNPQINLKIYQRKQRGSDRENLTLPFLSEDH